MVRTAVMTERAGPSAAPDVVSLMALLGYASWRNFETPIDRAMATMRNVSGDDVVASNFTRSRKTLPSGADVRTFAPDGTIVFRDNRPRTKKRLRRRADRSRRTSSRRGRTEAAVRANAERALAVLWAVVRSWRGRLWELQTTALADAGGGGRRLRDERRGARRTHLAGSIRFAEWDEWVHLGIAGHQRAADLTGRPASGSPVDRLEERRARRASEVGNRILAQTGLTYEQVLERLEEDEQVEKIVNRILRAVMDSANAEHRDMLAVCRLKPGPNGHGNLGLISRIVDGMEPVEVHALAAVGRSEPTLMQGVGMQGSGVTSEEFG